MADGDMFILGDPVFASSACGTICDIWVDGVGQSVNCLFPNSSCGPPMSHYSEGQAKSDLYSIIVFLHKRIRDLESARSTDDMRMQRIEARLNNLENALANNR